MRDPAPIAPGLPEGGPTVLDSDPAEPPPSVGLRLFEGPPPPTETVQILTDRAFGEVLAYAAPDVAQDDLVIVTNAAGNVSARGGGGDDVIVVRSAVQGDVSGGPGADTIVLETSAQLSDFDFEAGDRVVIVTPDPALTTVTRTFDPLGTDIYDFRFDGATSGPVNIRVRASSDDLVDVGAFLLARPDQLGLPDLPWNLYGLYGDLAPAPPPGPGGFSIGPTLVGPDETAVGGDGADEFQTFGDGPVGVIAGLGPDRVTLANRGGGSVTLGFTPGAPPSSVIAPFTFDVIYLPGKPGQTDQARDVVEVTPDATGSFEIFNFEPDFDTLALYGFEAVRSLDDLQTITTEGETGAAVIRLSDALELTVYGGLDAENIFLAPDANVFDPQAPGPEVTPAPIATNGPDRITGTPQADAIDALGGNDTVKGLAGGDFIDLGAGDDIVLSGAGNDTVLGGDGDDTIKAGAGDDSIEGGAGNDVILSGDGNDTILGGAGNDVIKPGRGDDVMDGGAGDDILAGFRGDELLVGGAGNDTLLGNLDDDTLTGGAGDDRMQGGPGRDTFVFDTPEWGDDRIVLDFLPQSDTLDFRGSGLAFADLSIIQAGDNVLIEAGDSSILVNSARFGPLDVADFAGDVLLFDA
ncbi:calcium-binding protein [Rubrimonas cliftonensis]|uniref:Hemolysin-type calcium-binding repeat-containing protein n=1 Tax=Rubrimonas cliftonensis TaxID=89524 RepID=A0A1H4CSL1_9RHOB|nr:calcium-binding protein [Rubrimonas cliftonensis]SEA63288.1 Hemolysin-type calcium-binding repeat-containing protein [Rubrimonas cliftonensis]